MTHDKGVIMLHETDKHDTRCTNEIVQTPETAYDVTRCLCLFKCHCSAKYAEGKSQGLFYLKIMKDLLGSEASSEEDAVARELGEVSGDFTVNKEYAQRLEHNKRREELHRCE